MRFKINNELSHRRVDDNGYLHVDKSPILSSGILEYYGEELTEGKVENIDGIKVDPKKLYKVYIPVEEMEKAVDSFKRIPIVDDHEWLGTEGRDAKGHQAGTTGDNVLVEDGKLMAALSFTSVPVAKQVQNKEKEELSAAYTQNLKRSNNADYDFIATEIRANHVALVDRGRCGSEVRVLNSIRKQTENKKMSKTFNTIELIVDGKKVDLGQFLKEESQELDANGNPTHDASIEKKSENAEEEKDKEADQKVPAMNEDEDKDMEDEEEGTKAENSSKSIDALVTKAMNAFKADQTKEQETLKRAYNEAAKVIGEFNPFGMKAEDIYKKALNSKGIEVEKESVAEMRAMLKACNSVSAIDEKYNGEDFSDVTEVEANF